MLKTWITIISAKHLMNYTKIKGVELHNLNPLNNITIKRKERGSNYEYNKRFIYR